MVKIKIIGKSEELGIIDVKKVDYTDCDGKRCGLGRWNGGAYICPHNNLLARFPLIAAEWCYEKNGDKRPEDCSCWSNRKVFWKCPKQSDHIYDDTINHRSSGRNCPFCRGMRVCLSNSLKFNYPKLIEEWHYEKNEKGPEEYTCGSDVKIWWKCPVADDHIYDITIAARVRGRNCPFCHGLRVCFSNSLLGRRPDLAREWDYSRNLEGPDKYVSGSRQRVWWKCPEEKDHIYDMPIVERNSGNNCPFCHGLRVCFSNSLLGRRPDLAEEWCHEKNEKGPDKYTCGSNQRVWWKCSKEKDHIYDMPIVERNSGSNCPFCRGMRVCLSNSLKFNYPDLAEEWCYEKNEKGPGEYTCGSNQKVWWKCLKSSCECHIYDATIHNRTSGKSNCPYCRSLKICPHNNLSFKFPMILSEWDYDKNTSDPQTFSPCSSEYAWWVCKMKHSWRAIISNRTKKDSTGCPHCSRNKSYSNKQIEWLNNIMRKENIHIQHALNHPDGEYRVPEIGNKRVDGFCEATNTIYELEGNIWHGNPELFDENDTNPVTGERYGDLYKKTIEKNEAIIRAGYNLVVMWELDYDNELAKQEELVKFPNESAILEKPEQSITQNIVRLRIDKPGLVKLKLISQ